MATLWTDAWQDIAARCSAPPRLLVACDFDGTIAPLVDDPGNAALLPEALASLRQLKLAHGVHLAFVSGRSLVDLAARVPLPGAIFAGNHGLEIRGLGLDGERRDAAVLKPRLAALARIIRDATADTDGVLVEDKGLTLSVHLRHVHPDGHGAVIDAVEHASAQDDAFRLQRGHLVLEILPDVAWDKGAAIRQIAARLGLPGGAVFFAGDDTTDEYAFRALPTGLTVHVGGSRATAARWRARDPHDMARLLADIARSRHAPGPIR